MNTFLYANANPILNIDIYGLAYSPQGEHGIPRPNTGGNVTAAGGVGGTVFGIVGGAVTTGVITDLTRTCTYTSVCFRLGLGVFGSYGGETSLGVSKTKLCSGVYETIGLFGAIGVGTASSSVSVSVSSESFSIGKAIFGPGVGLAGGLEGCRIYITCSGSEPCECENQ